MASLNTWTSSKDDFKMGLLLGMKQNKTPLGVDKILTDSQHKDVADQL
jgi:hypothetical protein